MFQRAAEDFQKIMDSELEDSGKWAALLIGKNRKKRN